MPHIFVASCVDFLHASKPHERTPGATLHPDIGSRCGARRIRRHHLHGSGPHRLSVGGRGRTRNRASRVLHRHRGRLPAQPDDHGRRCMGATGREPRTLPPWPWNAGSCPYHAPVRGRVRSSGPSYARLHQRAARDLPRLPGQGAFEPSRPLLRTHAAQTPCGHPVRSTIPRPRSM